jgi:hypothetical protein
MDVKHYQKSNIVKVSFAFAFTMAIFFAWTEILEATVLLFVLLILKFPLHKSKTCVHAEDLCASTDKQFSDWSDLAQYFPH